MRNRYVAAVREAKELHDMRLANSLRESRNLNPRRWWHTTKLLMGQNKQSQYPPIHTNGNEISDPTEKADLFNNYFSSQTSLDDSNTSLPDTYPSFEEDELQSIIVTPGDIYDHIRGINVNKAMGPDGISPKMLKEAGYSICLPLARLFNLSLSTGVVPLMWKKAHVIPIYKKTRRTW